MVQTAETDVVRSTVTGYDPVRTLHDIVLQIENGLADVAAACLAQRYQLVGDGTGCHSVVGRVKPLLCQLMDLLAARRAFRSGLHRLGQATAELLVGDKHAEAKLCEVLEERVAPRRTVTLLVDSIRSRRHRARVDRRATGSVGHHLVIAVELGDKLHVRSFAAARACARELEVRHSELRVLHIGLHIHQILLRAYLVHAVIPLLLHVHLGFQRLHHESLLTLLARTYVGTVAATQTVEHIDSLNEAHTGESLADSGQ